MDDDDQLVSITVLMDLTLAQDLGQQRFFWDFESGKRAGNSRLGVAPALGGQQ